MPLSQAAIAVRDRRFGAQAITSPAVIKRLLTATVRGDPQIAMDTARTQLELIQILIARRPNEHLSGVFLPNLVVVTGHGGGHGVGSTIKPHPQMFTRAQQSNA